MFFISMSILWLALLIWIIYRPDWYLIILQALLMLIMFTFRYNTMIYPIIAALYLFPPIANGDSRSLEFYLDPCSSFHLSCFPATLQNAEQGLRSFPPFLGDGSGEIMLYTSVPMSRKRARLFPHPKPPTWIAWHNNSFSDQIDLKSCSPQKWPISSFAIRRHP